jgi:hypothetical protein
MHKSATKCNETIGKWCKNKHGASKIIDTFEMYHSPRASLDNGYLLGAILVIAALILSFAVMITVVMSTLAGCRLRLASGRRWLHILHPRGGIGGSVLVRYRHEIRHCLRLGPVELMLQQGSFSATVREVANGLLLAHSFA